MSNYMSKLLLPPQANTPTEKYLQAHQVVNNCCIYEYYFYIHFILLNYKDDNYSNQRTTT